MDGAGSAHRSLLTEEVTSKIVLTATIVLFIAVLLVFLLHLFTKLYWWRVEDNHHHHHQPPPSTQQRRRFIFVSRQGGLCSNNNNNGLTPSDLSSLPIVVFRQDKDGFEECAVCLSVLVNGDEARLLPLCNHSFHVECIDMWLQSHTTCPICRNTVLLDHEQPCSNQLEPIPNPDIATVLQSQEPSNFPTNVLVWGSQDQISTASDGTSSNADPRGQGAVVLEISDSVNTNQESSSFNTEEEEGAKSLMTTRLRSLKRFLSRDKRVACSGGSSSNAAASIDP